jgi:hypothetical protein
MDSDKLIHYSKKIAYYKRKIDQDGGVDTKIETSESIKTIKSAFQNIINKPDTKPEDKVKLEAIIKML